MEETQAASAATEGPGHTLRSAREARGISVDDVAMRLKFAPRQIEALEADEYDRLPGIAIVRGMVRNYARLLDIDAAPLVAELEQRVRTGPNTVAPVDMHIPIKERRREGRAFMVLSLIVFAAVVAFALDWYLSDRPAGETVEAPPAAQSDSGAAALQAEPAVQAMTVADSAAPAVEAMPAVAPVAAEAAPAVVRNETRNEPVAVASAPAASATPAAPADEDRPLQMRFSEEVWVEVKDGQGRLLAARLAAPGSVLALDGEPPLSVVLGKAEAVELKYRGEPVDLTAHARLGVARLKLE